MYISKIQNQVFRAKLFSSDGTRVRNFSDSFGYNRDDVSEMAHPETEIKIDKFYSKKSKYNYGYDNFAKVTVSNPLWGTSTFDTNLVHETNVPYEENAFFLPINEMKLLSSRTNEFKALENRALANVVIDTAKKELSNSFSKLNDIYPPAILQKLLREKPEHGFSQERINEFVQYIEKKTMPIIQEGLKKIKNV